MKALTWFGIDLGFSKEIFIRPPAAQVLVISWIVYRRAEIVSAIFMQPEVWKMNLLCWKEWIVQVYFPGN